MIVTEHLKIKLESPTAQEFLTLRKKVGWHSISINEAETSLHNSLFHVSIYIDTQLVGMGRVIGDGVMYFYIQDVVVDPIYQGVGIGVAIMENIERYLGNAANEGSTIGLLAAKGKEAFYAQYGYIERPNTSLGHGMCKFI